ncbi:MAG: protein kinase [Gemmatimonadales bacterium]|nr:protein kinase [Gemmatimonadales bacterium]NIN10992.1 protein kinase [Gemmatimonadales bacterium]NIN49584.1 protein kinase [Gemmatimonadales bacterium]NIP07048.1 protein kinase [Gemmatimonadales bacterium]NIR01683.1 protein kinase [Gemmatimonadales bacterium]
MTELLNQLNAAVGDRYTIEREIGRGGMARVYLAHDAKHGRNVALKILRPELAASVASDRFLREIRIAANLTHPNILPVYDSGAAGDFLYFVMPYIEGESLRTKLDREGALPVAEAVRLLRGVVDALAEAHSRKIVHRDIKPDNVLLSGRHALVADFGVAKAVSKVEGADLQTTAGLALGTPAYMAPEQAAGAREIDHRADIYAVGALAYELLAGQPPFTRDVPQEVLAAHVTEEPKPVTEHRKNLPPQLGDIVMRCLAKDPADRWQSAQELLAHLEMVITPSGGITPTDTAPVPASRGRRPRRWALYAGGLVGVGVALAIASALIPGRAASGEVAPGADVIAVLPFATSGETVEVMAEGMVDLLSRNLDEVGAIRTVDPRTVLHRSEQRAQDGQLPREAALEVGREVGAGSVLLGSVVAVGEAVRISADLFGVDGSRIAAVAVDGSSDNLLGLVDSLSVALLQAIWRAAEPLPRFDVSAITTGDLQAIRAFLEGERHYRASEWALAQASFERAVAVDPNFALAYYRLARTAGWVRDPQAAERRELYAELAVELAEGLPTRTRTLVVAERMLVSGQADEAIDSLEALVQRYPDDSEAWFFLADNEYHVQLQGAGPLDQPADELLPLFDRVLEFDPTFLPALLHPLEFAFQSGDSALIDRYVGLAAAVPTADPSAIQLLNSAAAALADPPDVLELVSALSLALPAADDPSSDLMWQASNAVVLPLVRAAASLPADHRAMVIGWLQGRIGGVGGDLGPSGVTALFRLLTSAGRLAEARRTMETLWMQSRVDASVLRYHTTMPIYAGYAHPDYFLSGDSLEPTPAVRLTAQLVTAVDRLDAVAVAEAARGAAALQGPIATVLVRAGRALATVLEGDTAAGLDQLEAALQGLRAEAGSVLEPIWFRWVELLAAYPPTRERALPVLRRPWIGEPIYEIPRLFALAHALEAEGNLDEARGVYERFVASLSTADPGLAIQWKTDEAVRALGRLASDEPG